MTGRRTRNLIRFLTGTALTVALATALIIPIPETLPAIAIRQTILYQLEVALLVFYSWLLLITPAFSGLIRGQLPVEISTRGAKFAEEADQSTNSNEDKIGELRGLIDNLIDRQDEADITIKQLQEAPARDNAQPAIGSER
jgi:hypothetical protein